MSKKITFIRPEESFNKYQPYSVFIDEKHVIDLKNGSQQSIPVEKDKVEVEAQAKVKVCGSGKYTFSLMGKDELELEIRGNRFYNRYAVMSGGILPGLMAIHFIFPESQLMTYGLVSLGVLVLLYIIYIFTFERNAWLTISEM